MVDYFDVPVNLDGQDQTNAAVKAAIFGGEGHVYYGLAVVGILSLYALWGAGPWLWLVLVLIFGIVIGIAADLFSHGYTH